MAVVRSARSSNPIPIAICIFIALIATVVAIFFYLQNDKLAKDLATKSSDLKAFVHPEERSNDAVSRLLAAGGKVKPPRSAIGEANDELERLKRMIDAGGSGMTVDDLQAAYNAKCDDTGTRSAGSALAALAALKTSLNAEKDRANKAEQDSATAQGLFKSAKQQYDAGKAGFDKTLDDQKTAIAALTAKVANAEAALEAATKKYETEKTDIDKKNGAAVGKLVVELQQSHEELDKARGTIDALKRQIAMFKPAATDVLLREPDGRIVRTNQVTGETYIGLGKNDRITPGLTFAVYDPKLGVGSGPDGGGKAKIEVVEVGEHESLCRITFQDKGQHVETNDIIANPVYAKDKTRKFRFVVYGDFDLNGDGIPTAASREKLVRLIQSWGGIIEDQVTSQTDYLVMGTPPGSGGAKYSGDTDPNSDLAKARKAQQDKYNAMLKDARDYSVPMLNGNRFLGLIGYYNTTLVRY